MVVGMITTAAACFPALVMKLLDFVALYGLVLMPMGAVILMDFYLLPRMGAKSNYAEVSGKSINFAAAAAWVLTLLFSLFLNQSYGVEIFFLGLPGWFVAAGVYLVVSRIIQKSSSSEAV